MLKKKLIFVLVGLVLTVGLGGSVYYVKHLAEQSRITTIADTSEVTVKQSENNKTTEQPEQQKSTASSDATEDNQSSELPKGGGELDLSKTLASGILTVAIVGYIRSRRLGDGFDL